MQIPNPKEYQVKRLSSDEAKSLIKLLLNKIELKKYSCEERKTLSNQTNSFKEMAVAKNKSVLHEIHCKRISKQIEKILERIHILLVKDEIDQKLSSFPNINSKKLASS